MKSQKYLNQISIITLISFSFLLILSPDKTQSASLVNIPNAVLTDLSKLSLKNGIATGHPLSTEAAYAAMKSGGNAVDAAVAASFVLNVVQPFKMGIGGGGFILIWDGKKPWYLDHREVAPQSAHAKMFLDSSGKPVPAYPDSVTGPIPVGVPGTLKGLFEAHKKFGKLSWKSLLQPAIKIAKEGFAINSIFERELFEHWEERLKSFPVTIATFSNLEGKPLTRGQVLRQPMLASTLEKISEKGAAEFYEGELAKSWIGSATKLGVKITLDDLKNYKAVVRKPIHFQAFKLEVYSAPPPSSSGILMAGLIRFVDQYYKTHAIPMPESPERIIITSEALLHFQKMRDRFIADPPNNEIDPQTFYGSKEEKLAWGEIEAKIKLRLDKIKLGYASATPPLITAPIPKLNNELKYSATAHFSFVDQNNMAVSYTTTIEEIFGSGIVVPGHGFLLNNELADFDHEPGKANEAKPGKRPRSNMSPTLMLEKTKSGHLAPVAVIGAAGGKKIPTSISIFLENYFVFKMDARTALAFSRFHPTADGEIEVETGFSDQTKALLKKAGYRVIEQKDFWSFWTVSQMLIRRNSSASWENATEPRYEGMGLSF